MVQNMQLVAVMDLPASRGGDHARKQFQQMGSRIGRGCPGILCWRLVTPGLRHSRSEWDSNFLSQSPQQDQLTLVEIGLTMGVDSGRCLCGLCLGNGRRLSLVRRYRIAAPTDSLRGNCRRSARRPQSRRQRKVRGFRCPHDFQIPLLPHRFRPRQEPGARDGAMQQSSQHMRCVSPSDQRSNSQSRTIPRSLDLALHPTRAQAPFRG